MKILPQYPIYIPSKGRAEQCLTARCLVNDGVPFKLVVEEQEFEQYAERFGEKNLIVLPFSNQGSVIPARNWIKEHATVEGYKRHWQLDDNLRSFYRRWKAKRIHCNAGIALRVCEDFTDRYENIAISGLNYVLYITDRRKHKVFVVNCHIYSCSLILNTISNKWRGRYNEDADLCLQVLADGWCTVLINAFLVFKIVTMKMSGGNTDELYQGDGRVKMARSLERLWPGVVETKRRFQRPQHMVHDSWKKFDTPLIRRKDIDWDNLPAIDEYGMKLKQVAPEIKSETLRALVKDRLKQDAE